MIRPLLLSGLTLGLLAGAAAARASTAETATPPPLPDVVQAATPEQPLRLLGYGNVRRWFRSVLDASLWVAGSDWTMEEPFAIEFRYARAFTKQDIVKAALDQWNHLGYKDKAQLLVWEQQIAAVFPDVVSGDQLVGLYLPSGEARFYHNGREIGAIQDAQFGPAFFGIWLDKKSGFPSLRKALLGEDAGGGCINVDLAATTQESGCPSDTIPAQEFTGRKPVPPGTT